MTDIASIRQQYPQYNDMSDGDLASALHEKFYSDMPFDQFAGKIGLQQSAAPQVPGAELTAAPQKEQSFLAQLNDPTTAPGALLKAPDMFMRGATAGVSDYARAGMGYAADKAQGLVTGDYGKSFDQDLQSVRHTNEAQRAAAPVASYGSEILGGVTSPIFKAASGLVDKGLTKAEQLAQLSIPRYLKYGAQGMTAGTIAGAGEAQNEQGGAPTLSELGNSAGGGALVGGALGVAAPAVIEGASKLIGKAASTLASKAPAMTQDEFKAAAQAGYKAAEDAGVVINPTSFQKFAASLPDELDGYHPKVTPVASNIVGALQDEAAKGPITLDTLDKLRSIASKASVTRDPNEGRLAGNIAAKIDDYVSGLKPEDILLGSDEAKGAVGALTNARNLWRTYSKLKTISDIVDTGEALNDQNWVKNQFRAIVRKPAQFNRFTPDEQDAIKEVARTGAIEKALKLIPLRGIQMTATYAEPLMQQAKISNLQGLIARGGATPSAPGISPQALELAARVGAPARSPFMTGSSNQ